MNIETSQLPPKYREQKLSKKDPREIQAREFLGSYDKFPNEDTIIADALEHARHTRELLDPRTRENFEHEIIVEYNKYNKGTGKTLYMGGDKKNIVSRGDIYVGYLWDQHFYLDPASVPSDEIEQYLEYKEMQFVREYIDEQIIAQEIEYHEKNSGITHTGYQSLKDQINSSSIQSGVIAEHLVQSFLEKLSIDTSVDFEFNHANAYQDVEHKMDFIIKRKTKKRGIEVEATDEAVGIQFTINQKKFDYKTKQLETVNKHLEQESVDHVVLVTFNASDIVNDYKVWRILKNKHPGGPDRFWSQVTKEKIIRELCRGIMDGQEIEKVIQKNLPDSRRFDHTLN